MSEFNSLYVETLAMIILILGTILFFQIKNSQKLFKGFNFVAYTGILLSLFDITWAVLDGRPELRQMNIIINILDLTVMVCIGLAWLVSITENLPIKIRTYNIIRIVGIVIVLACAVIHIISGGYTGWTFYVDHMGYYHRGPYHWIGTVVCLAFMVIGSVLSNRCHKLATFSNERRRYKVLTIFPLPLIIVALSQSFLPVGIPTIQYGLIIGLIILYSTTQEAKITRDYLTKLPNRFAFEEGLQKAMSRYEEAGNTQLFVLAGDLNDFKEINDTYGHPEGDKALVIVANVLEKVFSDNVSGSMVARVGGDEFLALIECHSKGTVEKTIQDINDMLDEESRQLKYKLTISIGFVQYQKKDSLQVTLAKVDDRLYEVKREHKAARGMR